MALTVITRNVLRNRRRSLTTMLAIALGTCSLLLFGGFSESIKKSLLTLYIGTTGHLQIQHKDYLAFGIGNPTKYSIPSPDALIEHLQTQGNWRDQVLVATPVLRFGGMATNSGNNASRSIFGSGVVASDIVAMRRWNEFKVPFDLPPFAIMDAPTDSAVVGKGLARILGLCQPLRLKDCPAPEVPTAAPPGAALSADILSLSQDESKSGAGEKPPKAAETGASQKVPLELLAATARGMPNVARVQVLAAEPQGFKELDEMAIVLHLKQAQALVFGRAERRATLIMVQLKNTAALPRIKQEMQASLDADPRFSGLAVRDYIELNDFYVQTMDLFRMIFSFILILIGGVVAFAVSTAMAASVVERTAEIGTLRAMGVRRAGVVRLFLGEGTLIGLVGTVVGVLSGVALAAGVNALHLFWLPPGSSEMTPLSLRVHQEPTLMVTVVLASLAASLVAAIYPAWRASRIEIVDALRHV